MAIPNPNNNRDALQPRSGHSDPQDGDELDSDRGALGERNAADGEIPAHKDFRNFYRELRDTVGPDGERVALLTRKQLEKALKKELKDF